MGSLVYWGLCPLSFFYGLAMRLRSGFYRRGWLKSFRAEVPVISIGNLAVGGTGKTPMVDFLAKALGDRGVSCAIVSRGYGGRYRQDVSRVTDAAGALLMSPQDCGDEPYLLARRNPGVPVYVARKRRLGVQAAQQGGARLILLDDGFQHLAVQRDADIVLVDATRPFGNGRLLPAGILREPPSALQRADLIVMTRAEPGAAEAMPATGVPTMRSRHVTDRNLRTLDGKTIPLDNYAGKSALAFAGIARPDGFFRALQDFGFGRIESLALADHQEYDRETLNRLLGSCHNHDLLVTTEKDAVKLSSVNFPIPCCQVGVELVFDDVSPLDRLLDRITELCP